MSVEKYKFISPGIFVSEIDNTGRTAVPEDVGPAIIGRSEKGPILQPTKVDSFFDFVQTFGEPIPGGGGGDISRNGNYTSPTYAAYAAQAWFRNNAPVTFVRIGGQASEEAVSGGEAGWKTTDTSPDSATNTNGGAFGLFISNAPTRTYKSGTLELSNAVIPTGQTITLKDDIGSGATRTIQSGTVTNATTFNAGGGTVSAVATEIAAAINAGDLFTATANSPAGTVKLFPKTTAGTTSDTNAPSLYPGPSIKETADTQAQAIIAGVTPGSLVGGQNFGLVNAAGTTTTYVINGGPGPGGDFNTQPGGSVGGTFDVFFGGAGSVADVCTAITLAINNTVNADYTATTDGTNITVTQTTAGTAGNRTNTDSGTGLGVDSDPFAGGAVGSSVIVASVDNFILDNNTFGLVSATYGAVTGTLAATWYIDQSASIGLSGSRADNGTIAVGPGYYFDSIGTNKFKVQISSSSGVEIDTAFGFTDTDEDFIRKVFNTNPTLTNAAVTKTSSNSFSRYWLGESYEGAVGQLTGGTTTSQVGVILPLLSGSGANAILGGDFKRDYEDASTGFFFSQDLAAGSGADEAFVVGNMQNLFKLVARNSGDYVSRNLKVSIANLRAAPDTTVDQPYGSFSVLIRKISDTDNRVEIVEQFNNCNLNPNSQNFIAKKIGDKFVEWDDGDKRYREFGTYPNLSKYVYVEMPEEVRSGDTDPRLLPFGVRGPVQFKSFNDQTGSEGAGTGGRQTMVSGNFEGFGMSAVNKFIGGATPTNGQINFDFPQLRLRVSASEGSPVDPLNSFFGVDTTFNSSRFDKSTRDHLKIFPRGVFNDQTRTETENSFDFTLDDICFKAGTTAGVKFYAYKVGSRAGGASKREGLTYLRGTGSYTEVLDAGVDRFTTVFAGGFDGLDITESEPLREVNYPDAGVTPSSANSAVFNSVNVAIDSIRDPEVVEYNLAAMPGIVNSTLNTKLVDMCESRGDALAIIDLKGGFTPPEQSTLSAEDRKGTVDEVVNTLKTNVINSSYGAAYYPYVQIRDLNNGQIVTVPPSVPAIGALSYSEKVSELWFAPAGFTRGGLSAGRAGIPVIGVKDRLQSRDRDKLYENRINPIAQFPAEGIVIFGQKTLQIGGSALDRINVRRLMIFLKREISRFAATILFDQNVQTTWNRFRGQVEPFLRGVQAGLGITDFKMVLDETTTTPDLVDRNILYAKIFIKPARAIEFIAVDFILTDSGAAFED